MSAVAAPVAVRLATVHDLAAVCGLFGALHAFNAGLDPRFALADGWEQVLHDHLAHVWATGHGCSLLAWEGGRPVGLALWGGHTDSPLFRHRHWAELLGLYVVPNARGSGVAQQLLASGMAWARASGYERVQLYVTSANSAARRFYSQAGFTTVQEVWRLELGPATAAPLTDAECAQAYAAGHDLLTMSSHPLIAEPLPCADAQRKEPSVIAINPLGSPPRQNPQQVATVKGWVAWAFGLHDTPILVTELRCTEPGCPPVETVIALLDAPGRQRQWKLPKALSDLTIEDIAALVGPPDRAAPEGGSL